MTDRPRPKPGLFSLEDNADQVQDKPRNKDDGENPQDQGEGSFHDHLLWLVLR